MVLTPDDIHQLFIVKRTQVEMLADREFLIPDDETDMFLDHPAVLQPTAELYAQFVQKYIPQEARMFSREEMTQTYADKNEKLTYVYYAPPTIKDKQGVGIVNAFINSLTTLGAEFGIIITKEGFTPDARKALDAITQPVIQVFFDHQLYSNPINHVLVPRHTRLDDEKRRNILVKYKLQPRQILTISIDDPVIRYYGWSIGDLIHISRLNLGTDKTMVKSSLAYRIVSRVKFDVEKKTTKAKVTT